MLTSQEFLHLQKLSCLSFPPEKEKMFSDQIGTIIGFLQKLNEIPLDNDLLVKTDIDINRQYLLPRSGEQMYGDTSSLLQNAHHGLVNNSIVVKSVVEN